MPYKVKRPSETRHRSGKGPAAARTVARPRRKLAEDGPRIGNDYLGFGKAPSPKGATKVAAKRDAKAAADKKADKK